MLWSVRSYFPTCTIQGNKVTVSVVVKMLAMNCTSLEWFLNILIIVEDVENSALQSFHSNSFEVQKL